MLRFHGRKAHAAVALVLVALAGTAVALHAQSQIEFVIAVTDEKGAPVTDLRHSDVRMSENGVFSYVAELTPYPVPVQLTVAVDNGPLSGDALSHYRSGLTGLIKSLPADVEVTLITTAPQPRMVVRATKDRDRLLRGVNEFAPEAEAPRFTDTIVEFSKRYRTEMEKTQRLNSLPILIMVATTTPDAVSYEVPEIAQAFAFLQQRKAKVFIASVSGLHRREGLAPINDNTHATIGITLTERTRGHYEALANSSRLATLLPEWGREIAGLHLRYANQYRVRVTRAAQLTGPVQNPRIEVVRAGLTGLVSLDGFP